MGGGRKTGNRESMSGLSGRPMSFMSVTTPVLGAPPAGSLHELPPVCAHAAVLGTLTHKLSLSRANGHVRARPCSAGIMPSPPEILGGVRYVSIS